MLSLLALLPLAASMYIRADAADDYVPITFESFIDPQNQTGTWTPKAYSKTSMHPLASETAAAAAESGKHNNGVRIFSLVVFGICALVLLLIIVITAVVIYRRRKARRHDPYADTPLPTLDHNGRWGYTGAPSRGNDGRGKWSRLDESEPLTADLSSPEGSPVVSKKGMYEDEAKQ